MNGPIFIAGMGIISAIGNGLPANLQSLCEEKAGIGEMHFLNSVLKGELPVGEVKQSNAELAIATGLSLKSPRTALLSAWLPVKRSAMRGWDKNNSLRTGFISANTVGGMDKTENFFSLFSKNASSGRLADVVNHECGQLLNWLQISWESDNL